MGNTIPYAILTKNPNKAPPTPPGPKVYPQYVSSFVEDLHGEFFRFTCSLLFRHSLFWQGRRSDPPLKFRKPDHLRKIIDFELKDQGMEQLKLMDCLRRVVHYCTMSAHPYCMFHLLSGMDPYSLIGDFITCISPATMSSYSDAPVYYQMEHEISRKLRELVGYSNGTGDCIFLEGCSVATMYAIVLARHSKFPETKEKGVMHLPHLVIFVSEDSHCCYERGAIYTGIGLNNVVRVKTDNSGKMSVFHLNKAVESCLRSGKVPLMVGATSGTHVHGAFDPLEEIHTICKQYGIWLHSDGDLGGGLIFSEKQRHSRLKDIHLCDSFCGSFHKIGSATQTVTFLLAKDKDIFSEALSWEKGDEDFNPFKEADGGGKEEYFHLKQDIYDKYLEPVRRPDIVKIFMMIKGKGLEGMGANVDEAYEKAKFLMEELKRRQKHNGKFVPLMDEYESPVVTFYFIPQYLQKLDRTSDVFKEKLNLVILKILLPVLFSFLQTH